jgi:penicillin-binding protein 1A
MRPIAGAPRSGASCAKCPYSLALELRYSKDEILTIYLNRVYLGAGTRGMEAASQRYFGRSAAAVRPAEAAMLAGLLQRPSYFAPTANLARSRARAATVLRLMHEQGYLTDEEYELARLAPAELSDAAAASIGDDFADWVMATGPDYLTRETTEDVVIRTTFDPESSAPPRLPSPMSLPRRSAPGPRRRPPSW